MNWLFILKISTFNYLRNFIILRIVRINYIVLNANCFTILFYFIYFLIATVEGNSDENESIYSHDRDTNLEDCADEKYDDNNDNEDGGYSIVIDESSSDESTQVQYQTQNTCK